MSANTHKHAHKVKVNEIFFLLNYFLIVVYNGITQAKL